MKIYLIAGEPSGDVLGTSLMKALKSQFEQSPLFIGIGGEGMTAAGLRSLFPISQLSVMGLMEVLPQIPRILGLIRRTANHIEETKPDIVITIDAPDFCLRVAKKLKGSGIPIVHYVAPTVWAWKPGRAKKIAGIVDHLMALLPFEPPYFEREGLDCTFVGHPIIESAVKQADGAAFREQHEIAPDVPLLCLLPGSRRKEVERHLAMFGRVADNLAGESANLRLVMPTVSQVNEMVMAGVSGWANKPVIASIEDERHGALKASNAALAVSGSVSLELAAAGLPSITAYAANPLTGWLVRRMVKVPYANLINLLNEREVIPEYLFEDCTEQNLTDAVRQLLKEPSIAAAQVEGLQQALARLQPDGIAPSAAAAETIRSILMGC